MQRRWQGIEKQGRTDCHSRMTGTPRTSANRERDESGSGDLQPQIGLGGSHHDDREACGTPADVRVTQSSHVRRQFVHRGHRGERNKEKGNVVIFYFPCTVVALLFIHSRNNDFRGASCILKCCKNPEVLGWNQRLNILL